MSNSANLIDEEWLERDLRTALANSPHPLNSAIGVTVEGKSRIIGILEEASASTFVAFYNGQVRNGIFTVWDGKTIRKGGAYDVFKTAEEMEQERLRDENEIFYD